jgi:hypothetical protein
MIGAYFWACGIFEPELPPSIDAVQKRARLVSDLDEIWSLVEMDKSHIFQLT